MNDGRGIAATVILALVLLVAGALGAGIIFAHIAGRTTAERPPA
ncbi:MAG TPA: hypothetical protein VGI72_00200 [Gaiellales bacterium]